MSRHPSHLLASLRLLDLPRRQMTVSSALALLFFIAVSATAMPPNDRCADAQAIDVGITMVSLQQATLDGAASCDEDVMQALPDLRDAWFRFTSSINGPMTVYVADERDEPVSIAAYGDCPGTALNEIRCGSGDGLVLDMTAGETVLLRLAAPDTDPVLFSVVIEPAAQISGRVLERNGLTPAVPSEVQLFDSEGQHIDSGTVANDGSFAMPVARPGTYVAAVESQRYRAEVFDDLPCDDAPCDLTQGTPIVIEASAQVTDIDFHLDTLGRISGTVTDAADGQPLANTSISALDADGVEVTTTTDEAGRYELIGLPPQVYNIVAQDDLYMNQVYDDLPCPLPQCDPSQGTPLPLELNQHRQDIDFALQALGRITGRVTAADSGTPAGFIRVQAFDAGNLVGQSVTNPQGDYMIGGLPEGTYRVVAGPGGPYLTQLFPDILCFLLSCDLNLGTPVAVTLDATTSNINFALQRFGQIRGAVREQPTGDGIANADVFVFTSQGEVFDIYTTPSFSPGQYVFDGLPPDDYALAAFSPNHLGRVFGGGLCQRDLADCDLTSGTRFTVDVGSVLTDIDTTLDRLGVITGQLNADDNGLPLTHGIVRAWDMEGRVAAIANGTTDGTFRLEGLASGSYTVSAEHAGFRTDVYPGVPQPPCIGDICDPTVGEALTVDIHLVVADIDFRLQRKAAITGTVRTDDDASVAFAQLNLWPANGDFVKTVVADAEGHFIAEGLDAGDYLISSKMRQAGYRDEIYDSVLCDTTCSPEGGTVITVSEYGMVAGIDLMLTRLGVISGNVSDSLWNIPVTFGPVTLYGPQGDLLATTETNLEGHYEFIGLAPGTYYATASDDGFPEQLFPNVPCPQGDCDLTSGTPLLIDDNVIIDDVSLSLDMQQGIAGTVIDEATGLPIGGVQVQFHDHTGFTAAAVTDAQGHYREPLELGSYYLKLDYVGANFDGEEEAYDDVPCPRLNCDPRDVGVPVEVTDNHIVEGIDFAVTGHFCTPNSITLCLNDQRFRVRAKYRDDNVFLSTALTRPLTEDSGTFYFFGPNNLEIVVKVIDACVDPFHHFWVFATGLTDLEVELTVEDAYTGLTQTYTNPKGQPFQLIRDTTAFATCDVPGTGSATALASPISDIKALHALLDTSLAEVPAELLRSAASGPSAKVDVGSCASSDTALCLQQDRFQVEARWATVDGRSGIAQAVPLTADTGYFWFFADDNIEVMVKVLDVCVDPFNSFWVFAAGLTDVEVTLNVTDTMTGEVQQYVNGQGRAFVPIQDTAAFRTCF